MDGDLLSGRRGKCTANSINIYMVNVSSRDDFVMRADNNLHSVYIFFYPCVLQRAYRPWVLSARAEVLDNELIMKMWCLYVNIN